MKNWNRAHRLEKVVGKYSEHNSALWYLTATLSIGCNLTDITKPLLDPILGAMCSVLHDLNEKAFSKYLKKRNEKYGKWLLL